MPALNDLWPWLVASFERADPPAVTLAPLLYILLVSAALSIPRATWRYFGLLSTVVHELGHAFANLAVGRLVTGITLQLDHSGETRSYGRGGLRSVWAGFWGYPVPAVVGAVLVWAGLNGWAPAAMSVGTVILVVTILFIRNLIGLLILLGAIGTSVGIHAYVPAAFTGYLVIALGVALLVGGVRGLATVYSVHFSHRDRLESSDAYLLFRQTGIPSPIWLLLFTAVIGGSWFAAYEAVASAVLTA